MRTEIEPLSSLRESVKAGWAQLVHDTRANPTLLPDWTEIAVNTIGRDIPETWVYYQLDRHGRAVGVVPFFKSIIRMLGVKLSVLMPASNLLSYHAEILTCDSRIALLESFLSAISGWDLFYMMNVTTKGDTFHALRVIADRNQQRIIWVNGENSPYLAIDRSWDQFIAEKNKKFRYKYRRRHDWIQNASDCEMVWYEEPDGTDRLLTDMLEIEKRSWKRDRHIDIGSSKREVDYYRALLPVLANRGWLLANVLYMKSIPIAYSLCCACDSWVGQLKTSFDVAHAESSPGTIVIDAALERAFQEGRAEFDFLGDAAPHKCAWTSMTRGNTTALLFGRGPKAQVVGTLKDYLGNMSLSFSRN